MGGFNAAGLTRRGVTRGVAGLVAGGTALTSMGGEIATAQQANATITFNDQQSDGESVVIAEARTEVDARLLIVTGTSQVFRELRVAAGEQFTDRTVDLTTPIQETQTIRAELRTTDGADELLAGDRATIGIGTSPDVVGVQFVEADSDAGFNYPYFLYTPAVDDDREVSLLVEPNNTGTGTDDFAQHRQAAAELIERGGPRRIADALQVPLLVPVFPRPRSEPVDWRHYTHQLDQDTLEIESGPLERIDRQLLAMVDHAIDHELTDTAYSFRTDVMLNGFSASGNFVDRFTMLHPERVLSVTAGGLNGMALLPREEAQGHTLSYHVGIADIESITGSAVDLAAVSETNQFLYMGAEDENDTLPYDDAWTSDRLRTIAKDVYGADMIDDRFPASQAAYEDAGVTAQFRTYSGLGHRPPQLFDLIEFHRRSLAGEDVSDFGHDVSADPVGNVVTDEPRPAFDLDPQPPTVGQQLTFDAAPTERGDTAITTYTWDLADGTTKSGESVTHTYAEPGSYSVALTVENFYGTTATTTQAVTVTAQSTATPTPTVEATDATPTSTTSTPGFGIGAALAGVLGTGYLIGEGRQDEDTD